MTHSLITHEEARAIANAYGISPTDTAIAEDVERANSYANSAPSANALASQQWREDHPRTVRSGLTCPREVVAYWYVQQAQEQRYDALDAARNHEWAFG